jgi:hypothetical protein
MVIVNGYAELEDLEEWLGDSRGVNGALMERAIESASRVIDTYTKRQFFLDATSSARTIRSSGDVVYTGDFVTLTSVAPELDVSGALGAAYDTTSYRPGPLNANIAQEPYHFIEGLYSWGYVSVDAVWGWPSVPQAVTQACLMKAARIYKRRESVNATLGFDEFALRITREDADVIDLLSPYRWVTVA